MSQLLIFSALSANFSIMTINHIAVLQDLPLTIALRWQGFSFLAAITSLRAERKLPNRTPFSKRTHFEIRVFPKFSLQRQKHSYTILKKYKLEQLFLGKKKQELCSSRALEMFISGNPQHNYNDQYTHEEVLNITNDEGNLN